jgi:hypothetical protein
MIMLNHNHARKIVPCVLCQHLIFNLKKGFIDLFKRCKMPWGKIGINKNMGGKNWNKKYGAKLGYDTGG